MSRKGWRLLATMLNKTGKRAAVPTPEDAADENAFVQRTLAAETNFYGQTYSDAQLADLAAYFESPVGQAYQAGLPRLAANTAPAATDVMNHMYDHLSDEACAAVPCTPTQKSQLDDVMAKIQATIAGIMKSMLG